MKFFSAILIVALQISVSLDICLFSLILTYCLPNLTQRYDTQAIYAIGAGQQLVQVQGSTSGQNNVGTASGNINGQTGVWVATNGDANLSSSG